MNLEQMEQLLAEVKSEFPKVVKWEALDMGMKGGHAFRGETDNWTFLVVAWTEGSRRGWSGSAVLLEAMTVIKLPEDVARLGFQWADRAKEVE